MLIGFLAMWQLLGNPPISVNETLLFSLTRILNPNQQSVECNVNGILYLTRLFVYLHPGTILIITTLTHVH